MEKSASRSRFNNDTERRKMAFAAINDNRMDEYYIAVQRAKIHALKRLDLFGKTERS